MASNNEELSFIISIVGPAQAGKSTLLKSIVNYSTKINKFDVSNMVLILNSKKQLTVFIEAIPNIFSNLKCIKLSNLVISMIDGFFGMELDTFETLAISNSLNFKKYIFILTHLDLFKKWKSLKKVKKRIKDRLMKATNGYCKIFYFNGIKQDDLYFSEEIINLSRYMKKLQKNNNLLWKDQNFALISKIEFCKTINQNFAILTGFLKRRIFLNTKSSDCFIPGVGDVKILAKEKYTNKRKLLKDIIFPKKIETGKFNENCKNFKFDIQLGYSFKNLKFSKFFFFLLNFLLKPLKKERKERQDEICLIDSKKIFRLSGFFKEKIQIDLGTLMGEFSFFKDSTRLELELKEKLLPSISNKEMIEKTIDSEEMNINFKYCFKISGLSSSFKKYYTEYNVLPLIFLEKKKKKLIVAKINKNRWEKNNLNSGAQYIISIGWKVFLTKLYFCEYKGGNRFLVLKNLKANGFFYICFYAKYDQIKGQVIGVKTKRTTRNLINQGTSFSFSFSGEIVMLGNSVKLYKKMKMKGILFKKFKKTAFVKNMFHSDIEAIKFKYASIKTSNGTKGVIKNINSGNSHGIFRASFEKTIQNQSSVILLTYSSVKLDNNTLEIYYDSIPHDQQELLY